MNYVRLSILSVCFGFNVEEPETPPVKENGVINPVLLEAVTNPRDDDFFDGNTKLDLN